MRREIERSREDMKTAPKAHDASLYGTEKPGLRDFLSAANG